MFEPRVIVLLSFHLVAVDLKVPEKSACIGEELLLELSLLWRGCIFLWFWVMTWLLVFRGAVCMLMASSLKFCLLELLLILFLGSASALCLLDFMELNISNINRIILCPICVSSYRSMGHQTASGSQTNGGLGLGQRLDGYQQGVRLGYYYFIIQRMSAKGNIGPLSFKSISARNKLASNLIEFNKERMNQSYAFPSTLQQAEIHEIANTFGYNSLVNEDGSPSSICPCCKLPINTQALPMNYETTPDVRLDSIEGEEFKLSAGISMFFTFIKMAICYLILRLVLTDAFNLISSAAAGTYCENNPCDSLITSQISSYNKIYEQNLVFALDILNLITIIISIAFFNAYRKVQYKIENLINCSQHTQDDYTLFLKDIPILLLDQNVDPDNITFDYSEKLKKYLQEKLNDWIARISDTPVDALEQLEREFLEVIKGRRASEIKKVTSITMCFDLSEMQVLRDMRTKLMEKYVHIVDEREKTNLDSNRLIEEDRESSNFENVLSQIKLINHQEILMSQKFAEDSSMAFNLTHFVGKAFVCFEYQHFRDYISRELARDKHFLRIRSDYSMRVEFAATPNNIIWYNMSVQSSTRRKNIAISYLILTMVLAFAFGGTLLMTKIKHDINENSNTDNETLSLFLTVLMTIVTLVINSMLSIIVKHLTEYERHQTKSNYLFSHIIKVVMTQFINTTILYYVSSTMTHSPYLLEEGLVIQVSSLFLTSAIIQIFLNLLNPSAIIQTASKFLKYRNKSEIKMFQRDLNIEIEKTEFDVVDRYSYYILQIYACSFYSYLAPIATPCLILTLLAQYWIDKYNLFKRSSCKNEMDFFLSRTILKIFEASLFIFAFGNFVFSIVVHNKYVNSVNIAALVITGLYTLFIMFAPRHLEKKIFGSYEEVEKKAYSECMKERLFKEQYWTCNPATKFVKELDINTKQEVLQQEQSIKFANEAELQEAKQQLDLLLNQDDPKLDESSFKSPKADGSKINRSSIKNEAKE